MSTIKHSEWLSEQLKDTEFAAEYLNAASEDDDPKTYPTALRKVVDARVTPIWTTASARYTSKLPCFSQTGVYFSTSTLP